MTWKRIRPIGNRVLVKLDPRADHSGLIELPDEFRKQPETGTVIAVGTPVPAKKAQGDKRDRGAPLPELKPGDRVVFGKWNGTWVDPPDNDPLGEYYMMDIDPSLSVQDVYGVQVDPDENLKVGDLFRPEAREQTS